MNEKTYAEVLSALNNLTQLDSIRLASLLNGMHLENESAKESGETMPHSHMKFFELGSEAQKIADKFRALLESLDLFGVIEDKAND